ncbi:indole-3-glycerol phosphate synthase TrpC [Croceicoccus marinus]|uniref:Indole-3-glycerol phosphate synthase n=1 Tax=Croceicoccus marinus TaxID=450378 RepID=A0A7G6VRJ4_9SPHN|nr:indole-3-glycerol phosphate synthase TrpC [Croceicoccus marinus]QNE04359.1 indole-3-glycerol phosphate synthase TrpC [Croceicoccus marinus]
MSDRLLEICNVKREEVAARKKQRSLRDLEVLARAQEAPRGFVHRLEQASRRGFGLIAEIKKASPSKGLIRQDFDPPEHAREYATGGAACLSVLTDAPHFQGHEDYLVAARAACTLPVLRKDFMVDPWQVTEARAIGADAILIILAALDDCLAAEIEAAAIDAHMDVLVEVHDEAEMERSHRLRSRLIGVNNRDLRTFTTDIAATARLAPLAPPDALLVSESGIADHDDVQAICDMAGVRCFLVGESLMRQRDVTAATRDLLGLPRMAGLPGSTGPARWA